MGAEMSKDSNLIQARYALAILSVARTSDRNTAAKLMEGLISERPRPYASTDIKQAHQRAMGLIARIAATLQEHRASEGAWDLAADAIETWQELAQRDPVSRPINHQSASH